MVAGKILSSSVARVGVLARQRFTDVHRVYIRQGGVTSLAVVKSLNAQAADDEVQRFLLGNEADLLSELAPHPNILRLLGVMDDSQLITEYCGIGTLAEACPRMSMLQKTIALKQVASAMYHCHVGNDQRAGRQPCTPVVHRDIKASNVLVSRLSGVDVHVKLSDFNRAIKLDNVRVLTQACGSLTHMAPEMLLDNQEYGSSVDTFAFGMLGFEVLEGLGAASIYPGLLAAGLPNSLTRSEFTAKIANGSLRPTWTRFGVELAKASGMEERTVLKHLRWVIESCWSTDPVHRPDFLDIYRDLDDIAKTLSLLDEQNGAALHAIVPSSSTTHTVLGICDQAKVRDKTG